MSTEYEQLLNKIDKLDERLDDIEKILVVQEANLKEHMKRSDNLEKIVENVRDNELTMVKKHVHMMEGALKLLGVGGLIVTVITGVFKLIEMI